MVSILDPWKYLAHEGWVKRAGRMTETEDSKLVYKCKVCGHTETIIARITDIVCPKCGRYNKPSATTCEGCKSLIDFKVAEKLAVCGPRSLPDRCPECEKAEELARKAKES